MSCRSLYECAPGCELSSLKPATPFLSCGIRDAVDAPDEELADILAGSMKAEELRSWMSHNGITRPRGATKAESAAAAVERDWTAVAAYADAVEGIADRDPATAICSCGFEQRFPREDRAVEAANEHAEETGHEPKAWADDGRRLRG